ncbi:MAG: BMP family ABC transporter substrate-binding protein [Oscillospiraceae bacterium]|nr:BMP family ABC transporter substrate-binding protein [Oscillospiraceae bacterium]
MKKFISLLVLAAMVMMLLAGCGSGSSETPAPASTPESGAEGGGGDAPAEDKTLHLIYVGGTLGDAGIADATYDGYDRACKELPIKGEYIELPTDKANYKATMLEACDANPDLIVTSAGSGMIDIVIELAPEYPDTKFMVLDTGLDQQEAVKDLDNFYGILCAQNEVSYLCGYLGIKMSKTNKIGVVVGVEYPTLQDFITGYIYGALAADPDAKVAVAASGSWVDLSAAKEAALAQIRQGCDTVYCVGAASSFGSLEACKEQGVWGIGCDTDLAAQFIGVDDEQADCIITSAYKDWGQVTYDWIKACCEDMNSLKWGTVNLFGIADGGCKIIQNDIYKKQVPADVQAEMNDLIDQIVDGKIDIPSFFDMTEEDYNALKESVVIK